MFSRTRVGGDVGRDTDVQRAGVRVVPLEVRRVDVDAFDLRFGGQPKHNPVVALAAPPPRLPPVVHAVRVARRDEVVRRGEEQVARVQNGPARERGRDVGSATGVGQRSEVGKRFAVHPEPRDPAVGEDVEAKVGDPERRGHVEPVARVPLERGLGQQLEPLHPGDVVLLDHGTLDRAAIGVVAPEEAGVDDDAADDPGHAEADDAPVVTRIAPAARLPAVHLLAPVGVAIGIEDGSPRLQQVLLGREELVVRDQHHPTEAPSGEVGQRREVAHAAPLVSRRPACSLGKRPSA
jgi:hypothetical protein